MDSELTPKPEPMTGYFHTDLCKKKTWKEEGDFLHFGKTNTHIRDR